jgi:hypothetical protein
MLSLSRESVAIGTHEHLFSQCKLAYGDVDTWISIDALSWICLVAFFVRTVTGGHACIRAPHQTRTTGRSTEWMLLCSISSPAYMRNSLLVNKD